MSFADDLDLQPLGGPLADRLESMIEGPSPYNSRLPWSFQFMVHENMLDDLFVSSIQDEDGQPLLQLTSSSRFPTVDLILLHLSTVLQLEPPLESAGEIEDRLADLGYRWIVLSTGRSRGHVNTTTVVADPISELDAALQLNVDIDDVMDLLIEEEDSTLVMRDHVKFSSPFRVAKLKGVLTPKYREIVAYMRAMGAH